MPSVSNSAARPPSAPSPVLLAAGDVRPTSTTDGLAPIGGNDLRHAVLVVLHRRLGHPWSVAQIVRDLAALGLRPDGDRPCKVVADAVWEELHSGRIRQAGLAAYRLGDVPEHALRRARQRLLAAKEAPHRRARC